MRRMREFVLLFDSEHVYLMRACFIYFGGFCRMMDGVYSIYERR